MPKLPVLWPTFATPLLYRADSVAIRRYSDGRQEASRLKVVSGSVREPPHCHDLQSCQMEKGPTDSLFPERPLPRPSRIYSNGPESRYLGCDARLVASLLKENWPLGTASLGAIYGREGFARKVATNGSTLSTSTGGICAKWPVEVRAKPNTQ